MRCLTLALVALAMGCAGYTPGGSMFFDHDRDPATPPIEVTQEQRCAIYDGEIALIDAKPTMSEVDRVARGTAVRARMIALCPPLPAGP